MLNDAIFVFCALNKNTVRNGPGYNSGFRG